MREANYFTFSNFTGGIDRNFENYGLSGEQLRDSLNVCGFGYTVGRRSGCRTLASPALRVYSLGTYEAETNTALVGIGINDGVDSDIYQIEQDGTVTSIQGAAVVSTDATRKWAIQQAPQIISGTTEGPVYMMNGLDPVLQWDGTGNVAIWTPITGAIPNGKYMIYHSNRLLVAGVESDASSGLPDEIIHSTLYASAIADPRTWLTPEGITTIFDPEDGENITGLGAVGPYPLVFKDHKTYIVTDTDSLAYRALSTEIGCIAYGSIAESDSGTFFLTADKKIAVTNGSTIEFISTPVDTILGGIEDALIDTAAGIVYNQKYYLSICDGSTTNNIILEYDLQTQGWWIHKIYYTDTESMGVNDWAVIDLLDPVGKNKLYTAGAFSSGSVTPKIYETFIPGRYSDDDVNYPTYLITGWETFGQPHLNKILRQIRVDAAHQFDLFTAKSFNGTVETQQDEINWELLDGAPEGTETDYRRYYTPGTARSWSFKFESTAVNAWRLYSYTVSSDLRSD